MADLTSSSSSDVKNESNEPYTSISDNLSNQRNSIPRTSSDVLQDCSAPTQSVYINMGISDHTNDNDDNDDFVRPITTTNPPLLPSYTDNRLSTATLPRNSHYRLSRPSSAANRFPYLSYQQRRSSARQSEAPDAPMMPEPLSSSYTQERISISKNGTNRDLNDSIREREEDSRPSKSLWIISRLVFFVLAIEFMEAVETALTVPILNSLHVDESFYSMAWLISPILGFFFQPVIGMWSDSCKCRWGRRRPFILAFAIGAYIGIALLLNSADLGLLFGDSTDSETIPIRAVIITAAGVTLLDFCADSANAPIRAYLIDTTNPSDQERGFILHAILGFGGGLGFSVGTVNWKHIPMFRKEGGEFSVIFYIATFLFIVCTISTLTSIREEPLILLISSSRDGRNTENPYDDDDDDDEQPEIEVDETRPLITSRRKSSRLPTRSKKPIGSIAKKYFSDLNKQEGFLEIDPATSRPIPHDHVVERPSEGILLKPFQNVEQTPTVQRANAEPFSSSTIRTQEFDAELQQKAKLVKLGFMRRSTYKDNDDLDEKDKVTILSMIISMVRMPPRLWKLMICQVIGWIGYFATHLYFTDFVAVEIYNGTAEHGPDDPAFTLYKQGVTMGCWGLFVFSASSAVYAFCLERWLANRFSLKVLYFTGYFIYVVGCIVNFFVHHVIVNIAMCFTFGILVVSLNTLPYQMLSQFHADETYRNRDGSKRGIGVDCSLLNSCHFLGELIVAAGLSPLLAETGVNYCMVIAAAFTFIGNICMFFLFYFKN